jgi:hypothetical protein
LVESVCSDPNGHALPGVTPLDPVQCLRPRKLQFGERLPYHKRDWPNAGDTNHPDGYQQSDSFPVLSRYGPAVVQT